MRAKKVLTALCVSLMTLWLILFPIDAANSTMRGLKLCATAIIPALFPFFVLSNTVINSFLINTISSRFTRITERIFNLPGSCASTIILGIIGGYPVGAISACTLFEHGLCNKKDAQRLLLFCNNSGPAFIIGAVGGGIFKSPQAGILLFFVHILSSSAIGIALGVFSRKSAKSSRKIAVKSSGFTAAFSRAIASSALTCINICAYVVFFSVAIQMLLPIMPSNMIFRALLTGICEVTCGIALLSSDSGAVGMLCAAFLLGFSGFCIHAQVISKISANGFSTLKYILFKLLHGVVSVILTIPLLLFFG